MSAQKYTKPTDPTTPPRLLTAVYEVVPIDAVRPYPRNVNEGDEGAISESMDSNGVYGALYAQRSTGYILKGNHTWNTGRRKGLKEIGVLWYDIDDDHARRIVLSDNETTRRGHNNALELQSELEDILNSTGTLAGTGFDLEGFQELAEMMSAPSLLGGVSRPPQEAARQPQEGQGGEGEGQEGEEGKGEGLRRFTLSLLTEDDYALFKTAYLRALEQQGTTLEELKGRKGAAGDGRNYSPETWGLLKIVIDFVERTGGLEPEQQKEKATE